MSNKKRYSCEKLLAGRMLVILTFIFCIALICTAVVAFYYWIYFGGTVVVDHQRWGTFGEYFGGILTPILSFLALIGILLTIFLQNRERREAQEEIKFQHFEKTFFEMLGLLGDIVGDISMNVMETEEKIVDGMPQRTFKSTIISGRACFMYLRDELQKIYKADVYGKTVKPDQYPQYIRQAYNKFADKYEHKIGHYFRFLYRIFKHIHESDPGEKLSKKQRKNYSGITRGLLSSNELALLFYDCFYTKGDKFAKLILEYSLFENMEIEKLYSLKVSQFRVPERLSLADMKRHLAASIMPLSLRAYCLCAHPLE